jgi:hypothetical protein
MENILMNNTKWQPSECQVLSKGSLNLFLVNVSELDYFFSPNIQYILMNNPKWQPSEG